MASVGVEGVAEVEVVDMVCAHHDDLGRRPLGDAVADAVEKVGVAGGETVLGLGCIGLLGHDDPEAAASPVQVPGPPARDESGEAPRLVLHAQPDVVDVGVVQVRQREVDQLVVPRERQRRFGTPIGQDLHTGTTPAGLHDREYV